MIGCLRRLLTPRLCKRFRRILCGVKHLDGAISFDAPIASIFERHRFVALLLVDRIRARLEIFLGLAILRRKTCLPALLDLTHTFFVFRKIFCLLEVKAGITQGFKVLHSFPM